MHEYLKALLLNQEREFELAVKEATNSPSQTFNRDVGIQVTRELAHLWIEAFHSAQLATLEIWKKVPAASRALAPLSEDSTLREILNALPSKRALDAQPTIETSNNGR
ncbi:uncharacterized protein JCM15063_004309 [Sporobolomyces koalae]|uniref:uncharacterized protein n=1 Tax=Sporobolomyces koalae TaxID=500713 RepID=UPI0031799943